MQSSNARLGLKLFAVYLLLYGGFVFLNAFSATTMDIQPIPGINLAIVYGFVLIVGAFVLAMVYGVMCKSEDVDGPEIAAENGAEKDGGVA